MNDRWQLAHNPIPFCCNTLLDPKYHHGFWRDDKDIAKDWEEVIKKLFSKDERVEAMMQFSAYRRGIGDFSKSKKLRWEAAEKMTPLQWWGEFGNGAPLMKRLATRIFSQVTTSSACERNWSSFDFLWSIR